MTMELHKYMVIFIDDNLYRVRTTLNERMKMNLKKLTNTI